MVEMQVSRARSWVHQWWHSQLAAARMPALQPALIASGALFGLFMLRSPAAKTKDLPDFSAGLHLSRRFGVICLAFPLLPPGAARQGDVSKSRLGELEAVPISVPVLVVQGARDPFGMPPPGGNRSVIAISGTHTLSSTKAVRAAVSPWLAVLLAAVGR